MVAGIVIFLRIPASHAATPAAVTMVTAIFVIMMTRPVFVAIVTVVAAVTVVAIIIVFVVVLGYVVVIVIVVVVLSTLTESEKNAGRYRGSRWGRMLELNLLL